MAHNSTDEYVVIVSAYTIKKLHTRRAGHFTPLDNLTRELNKRVKAGWAVQMVGPIWTGSGIAYTVLLKRTKPT